MSHSSNVSFVRRKKACECGCGGDPRPSNRFINGHNGRRPAAERFWDLVVKGESCWTWRTATVGPGRFWDGHKVWEAPRWAYANLIGEIPQGLVVRHKCDNPPCVRPDHLEVGTKADNQRDMVQRGRSLRGSRHNLAKLNEDQVRDIKRRLASGEKQADLHREYGVSRMCISEIYTGRKWGWLK